ncbi:ATPase inhibitor, mitochondrial-like [Miscanthus floridulus]|uniref:ATPase inhibitor, mitochondrial-like n=1 Tax=Miscanthus floridulus TaxID=154761 RepID=UPI00345A3935
MAMRTALSSLPARLRAPAAPASAAATGGLRLLSDGKGRVLSEEERAKESVYIQKMEKERLEKLKKRLEQEKSGADKAKPADADKKAEGST